MEFKTTELVIKNENQQWEIGDSLIEDCGSPSSHGVKDNSQAIMYQIAEELEDHGVSRTVMSLSQLRLVAYNFPVAQRNARLSWSVHRTAETPEMLAEIVRMAGKRKLTTRFTEELKGVIERQKAEEARKKREAEQAKLRPQNAPDFEVLISALSNTQDLNFQTFDQSMISRLREACLRLADLIDTQLVKETNVHVLKK